MTSPAVDAINELLTALDWLTAELLPGTRRPFIPQMTAEKRAELDAEAAKFRQVFDIGTGMQIPLGESPAPMNLAIADMIAEISDAGDELCQLVSLAAKVPPMRPAAYAWTDPRPYLRRVAALVPGTPSVAATVEKRCDDLVFRAHNTLGLLGDGQLFDALCPWCDGKTAQHPVGGAPTLRVRATVPDGRKIDDKELMPGDLRWLVVCEGGRCEPPASDFGETYRGRPAWPLSSEGEWLADRIERHAAAS